MPVVHNRSSRHRGPDDPVLQTLATFKSVEDLHLFAVCQHPQLTIQQAVAHADGTHDLIVAAGSHPDVFTFTVTCKGEILAATAWDRLPAPDELVLRRCQDFAKGRVAAPGAHTGPCRFGGHEKLAMFTARRA